MDIDISTSEGRREMEAYMSILEENPQYASAIMNYRLVYPEILIYLILILLLVHIFELNTT
jgi:hypothetical protein